MASTYISKLFLLCMKKAVQTADQVLKKLSLVDIKSHSARIISPVRTLTKSLLRSTKWRAGFQSTKNVLTFTFWWLPLEENKRCMISRKSYSKDTRYTKATFSVLDTITQRHIATHWIIVISSLSIGTLYTLLQETVLLRLTSIHGYTKLNYLQILDLIFTERLLIKKHISLLNSTSRVMHLGSIFQMVFI